MPDRAIHNNNANNSGAPVANPTLAEARRLGSVRDWRRGCVRLSVRERFLSPKNGTWDQRQL